jgi:hypothetical protein
MKRKALILFLTCAVSMFAGAQVARAQCTDQAGRGHDGYCNPRLSCGWFTTCIINDCGVPPHSTCQPIPVIECNFFTCYLASPCTGC